MGRGAVECGEDVACTVVGIGVGGVTRRAEQLTLVVVGVGYGAFPGSSVCGNVAHAVIGILIPQPAASHGCHLQRSPGAVNIPVGILPGDRAAGNVSQPPQTVIAHGQGSAHTSGSGIQAAVFTVVGIPLGISRTAQLPALPRQLVVLIVPLTGAQYRIAVFNLLAVDQAAKRIIGIQIGNRATRSFAFASLRAVF